MMELEWSQKWTQFQAVCRGYLMRRDLSSVRTQFENIVLEIDGGLDHLHWIGNLIPKPHFTDTESRILQYGRSKYQSSDCVDYSIMEQDMGKVESETAATASEILVPEKDEAPGTSDSFTTPDADNEVIPNLTDESATLWSAMNPDVSHSSFLKKGGSQLVSDLNDTELSSESLKQQRSTLAMELLWIQQAISSRKKYLTLRQRMDVSH